MCGLASWVPGLVTAGVLGAMMGEAAVVKLEERGAKTMLVESTFVRIRWVRGEEGQAYRSVYIWIGGQCVS